MSHRVLLAAALFLAACGGQADDPESLQGDVQAPSKLQAQGGNHSISLSWNARGSSRFTILRGTAKGGPYTQIGTAKTTSYKDGGLAANATFFYVVKAASSGAPSNEASAVTAPAAPAHVQSAIGGGQVSLAWDPVPGAVDYVVTTDYGDTLTTADLSITDLLAWGRVTYSVQARNAGGPGDAASASGDADAPAIVGANGSVYVTGDGEETHFDSMEGWAIQAVGADGAAHAGLGTADGRFTIPGVPQGTYWVGFGDGLQIATSARSIDVGSAILGRRGATYARKPATLRIDAQNLRPWMESDWLQLYSADVGLAALDVGDGFDSNTPPAVGVTSLQGYDLSVARGTPLLDAQKGDRALLTQMSLFGPPAMALWYHSVTRALALPPVTMAEGQTTPVAGAFVEVAQDQALSLSWLRPDYAAHASEIFPGAQPGWAYLKVFTGPALESYGDFGGAPNVAYLNFAPGDGVASVSLQHGNPYPRQWALGASLTFPVTQELALPGLRPAQATGQIAVSGLMAEMSTVGLRLSPPRALQINGADAVASATAGAGLTPTLSWTAPAVGSADAYSVHLSRLVPDGQGGTRIEQLAVLRTAGTSAALPPGLLQQGQTYFAYVKAISQPGVDPIAQPYATSLSLATAGAFTNTFTP
jgi:hypothetical protein